MKYPKYLAVGNWLFIHLQKDEFEDHTVGGPCPENLYYAHHYLRALYLSRDLRTYEGLIEYGCEEPDEKELLRLLRI